MKTSTSNIYIYTIYIKNCATCAAIRHARILFSYNNTVSEFDTISHFSLMYLYLYLLSFVDIYDCFNLILVVIQ